MLALGALLVVRQEASAGVIIAATILTSRALAPLELVIANWRSIVAVRQSYRAIGSDSHDWRHPPIRDRDRAARAPRQNLCA